MRRCIALLILCLIALPAIAQQRKRPPDPTADQVKAQLPAGVRYMADIAYDTQSKAQKLDLYLPANDSQQPRAAVVIVHGGGWSGGDKRRGQWWRIPADYAAAGYVAISVNYRLTDEAPSPAQVEDAKCAVRWLRAHATEYGVDPNRIGAYGNSAGAHLVSMLGLVKVSDDQEGTGPHQDQSSMVQAVVASATPADFQNWGEIGNVPSRLGKTFLAGPADELAKRARQASPISFARDDAPPFFLIHGNADRTVPIMQSERFAKALRDAGAKEVRYMMFDNEGHGVFGSQRLLTYPAMKAFFDEALAHR